MSALEIDTGRIAGAGSGVSDVAASLAAEIGTMQGLLGQIRAGWQSSEAAPRFVRAMDSHLADASAVKDALLGHGSALSTAAGRFAQAESAVADTIPVLG